MTQTGATASCPFVPVAEGGGRIDSETGALRQVIVHRPEPRGHRPHTPHPATKAPSAAKSSGTATKDSNTAPIKPNGKAG